MLHKILLSAALASASFSVSAGQWHSFEHQAADGKTRPFALYQPDVAQGKRPLLVFLHGAVSGALRDPLAAGKRSKFVPLADKEQFYVLFPAGEKGATWFDEVGSKMVLAQIAQIKRDFAIDENKVFLGGFSDGGSGALYFAGSQPQDFAGFISLNGSTGVAAHLGEQAMFLDNLNRHAMLILNTDADELYPASMMRPLNELWQKHQPQVRVAEPKGNHTLSYFADFEQELQRFLQDNQQQTQSEISWESNQPSSYQWLRIDEIRPEAAAASWHQPYQLTMRNDKASFGITPDPKHQGDGMKVAAMKAGSTAEKMGVQVGDVIVKMGDAPLDSPYASYVYLGKKRAGDATSLTLLRDGKELTLNGKFNEGYDYEVFKPQNQSAKVLAKIQGDTLEINTSRIAKLSIDFAKMPNAKAIKNLVLNGQKRTTQAKGIETLLIE